MTALNKQALRYGDNVLWFLNELAAYDSSDIDGGEFDVYGEDRNGLEGCSTIDVTELAADAAKLIEAAEKKNDELRLKSRLLENADRDISALRQRIADLEARVLPEECPIELSDQIVDICDGIIVGDVAAQMIWESFRDAMLQDAGIGVKGE
ncbi:hypothetical protein [Citrobacter freundii]|uniref:hypothetical protein n=1 Tax=Citrobacter freundii TaxID=546 RepID=UPI0023AF49D1|nr:hypothetical protein [Citrobacter freundii]